MKEIRRYGFRIEYTRYFKNQVCSRDADTYEQAQRLIEYFNEWERPNTAKIVAYTIEYSDGTTQKVVA